jgi:uncharacterized sulfatase
VNLSRRAVLAAGIPAILPAAQSRRPNILFCIADDMSFAHTGATGCRTVNTPGFDRVASSGVLFRNAYSLSPGCAPSRAGLLTGRYPWQLREAGTHASGFPRDLTVYPDLLAQAGYYTGLTGKGAGPTNFKGDGWPHNPAGPSFDKVKAKSPVQGIHENDYAANFEAFLNARPKDSPFCFWYGCHEPHRAYEPGSGARSGKRLDDVVVPPFLPDTPETRSDLLDYMAEIEHFDRHLVRMLDLLEKRGELANTLVVVTADNGCAFPGSKATLYDYGIHLPLAIMLPAQAKGGRAVNGLVSFADFAPTFLDAAGLQAPANLVGQTLLPLLRGDRPLDRRRVFSGRERHSHARRDNLGYPARAMREGNYLCIWNMKPERWPAGDESGGFADIDNGPTKRWMMSHRDHALFAHSFGLRPAWQLFDVAKDPGCLNNLAGNAKLHAPLRATMEKELTAQGDLRLTGNGGIWESYPRYSPMRPELGGFVEQGKYNPAYRR